MGIAEETFDSVISSTIQAKVGQSNALSTPPVNTPPGAKTPPTAAEKRRMDRSANVDSGTRTERSKTLDSAVDPNALSKALQKEFEDAGRSRDVTPGGSPSRKRQRVYGDR
jgi:cell division cycle 20-like protein 1 (cofactor of APC complex)